MKAAIEPPFAYVFVDGVDRGIKVRTDSESESGVLSALYCVIVWDGSSKYWFLNIYDMSLGYGADAQWGYAIGDIANALPDGYSKRDGLSIYRIMEKGPLTESFALSYMPQSRQRITYGQRVIAYRKYDGKCAYCGKPIEFSKMQVDHLVSHYRNQGKDETANYMPSCADCNGLKSDYGIEEFREKVRQCAKKASSTKGNRAYRIAMKYGLLANPMKRIVFYFEKAEKGK